MLRVTAGSGSCFFAGLVLLAVGPGVCSLPGFVSLGLREGLICVSDRGKRHAPGYVSPEVVLEVDPLHPVGVRLSSSEFNPSAFDSFMAWAPTDLDPDVGTLR